MKDRSALKFIWPASYSAMATANCSERGELDPICLIKYGLINRLSGIHTCTWYACVQICVLLLFLRSLHPSICCALQWCSVLEWDIVNCITYIFDLPYWLEIMNRSRKASNVHMGVPALHGSRRQSIVSDSRTASSSKLKSQMHIPVCTYYLVRKLRDLYLLSTCIYSLPIFRSDL